MFSQFKAAVILLISSEKTFKMLDTTNNSLRVYFNYIENTSIAIILVLSYRKHTTFNVIYYKYNGMVMDWKYFLAFLISLHQQIFSVAWDNENNSKYFRHLFNTFCFYRKICSIWSLEENVSEPVRYKIPEWVHIKNRENHLEITQNHFHCLTAVFIGVK